MCKSTVPIKAQHPVVHSWAWNQLDQKEQLSLLHYTVGLLARSISLDLEASEQEAL